jgi:hypothetical protein
MLHKCANPACPNLFRSLSRGKLFLLHIDGFVARASRLAFAKRGGRPVGRMERFWLCDGCSPQLTLTFERGRGMVTVPLPARKTSEPVLHLSRMQQTARTYRAESRGDL